MSRGIALALGFVVFLLVGCASEPLFITDFESSQLAEERAAAAALTAEAGEQLETARRLHEDGAYADSILIYSELLDGEGATASQRRLARYGLAESYFAQGETIAAALSWKEYIERYPEDSRRLQATLMAARAFQAANQCDRAVNYYEDFQAQDAKLNGLVFEWIGDCHVADRRLEEAAAAYRKGLNSTDDRGVQAGLREKMADVYLSLEDVDAAIAEYDAILEFAEIGDFRAKIDYLAGQALAAAGQTDGVLARYYRAIENYPEAEYAYFALIELVYGGATVDEFQRGLVDYHAGAKYPDAYGAAIRAFDRYLASGPTERVDEALYYKALAQRAIGQIQEAVATLEQLIAEQADSDLLDEVWYEKGMTQAEAGDTDAAIASFMELVDRFPDSDLAPEAIVQAGRIRQREGIYSEAAELYERLAQEFPGYEDADAVLWHAGLSRHRAGQVGKAVGNWRNLLHTRPDSIYAPKTFYWLGKVGARPEDAAVPGYWDQLLARFPYHYYALRVKQLEAGESLTSTQLISAPVESLPWDGDQYEAEIIPWLRGWTEMPAGVDTLALPLTVTESTDFSKGQFLLQAGLRAEALDAFERVRSSVGDEPLTLAALGRLFREHGLYGLAASSAARLADLWPDGDIQDAPLTLQHLVYPLAYDHLLTVEAENRGLDPLLLAALVRQESLFEPTAESWAGARGLGQVMPTTGESIAQDLGIVNFEVDDLYRPSISIQFGAYYLASQLERFDDQVLVALAAYNAGPGSALLWLDEVKGDDLDLFVEIITAVQSRLYLQGVYESYVIYDQLYRSDPATWETPSAFK